jgi:bacterioferritin (cytochrome b1)
MPPTDREMWLLNFFRNSELHGALLMGRLARSLSGTELLTNITRHCATEAHHAALLTEVIADLGGEVDPKTGAIQEHYSREGGIPKVLVDLLVLSEILENRVLSAYREHLNSADLHPKVRVVLEEILREEEEHGAGENTWLEQTLRKYSVAEVVDSRRRWSEIDRKVAGQIYSQLDSLFPVETQS